MAEFNTREFAEQEAQMYPFEEWTEKTNVELIADFIEMLMQNAEDVAEMEEDDAENVYDNYVDNYKSNSSILDDAIRDYLGLG